MLHVESTTLYDLVVQIFVSAGAARDSAQITAEHLVLANLKGHDSHGIGMIPKYVDSIRRNDLNPDAHIAILKDHGSVILVDGCLGFGQVVGAEATELAIERGFQNGIACVGLRNAHHLGRIGTYGEQCAKSGLVSVHFVNAVAHQPQVAPWGGKIGRLQTNPFCCAVPSEGDHALVLDMATSVIALGKVRVAYNAGRRVPGDALRDFDGKPTDDPSVMYTNPQGTMGPFGKYKGFGLAVMCEALGGALAGDWTMQPRHARTGNVVNNMLMMTLNPALFGDVKHFQQELQATLDYIRATPPSADFDRVRIAGEPEHEATLERSQQGIPIDDRTWTQLVRTATSVGLTQEQIDSAVSAEP